MITPYKRGAFALAEGILSNDESGYLNKANEIIQNCKIITTKLK